MVEVKKQMAMDDFLVEVDRIKKALLKSKQIWVQSGDPNKNSSISLLNNAIRSIITIELEELLK